MAQRDRAILEALRTFLGVGSIGDSEPRVPHWQPISRYTAASLKAHRAATIPFAERFLLPSAKRRQFEEWRDELLAYDRKRPKRVRSICAIEGCEDFVRGQGLCRRHYYRVTGY